MLLETKQNQRSIRKHHLLLFFKIIKRYGPISRAELAKLTQMSATSASRIVKELIEQNFINEVGQYEGNVGRRATMLEVNPNGSLIFGVNIELETIEVGIVDLNGSVLLKKKEEFVLPLPPDKVLDRIVDLIHEIQHDYTGSDKRIMGCGISVPGIVDFHKGTAVKVPQFGWDNVDISNYLQDKIDVNVFVENQVKAILLGESLYGNAVGVESAVCIYLGSGLGAAFMEKEELIRGVNNVAGEIGHTTVNPYGTLCDCGRIGCLQTYICPAALEKESGRSINEIFSAQKNGEEWAIKLLERAADYLAITISNIACTNNPEVIILAGQIIDQRSEWVESVKQKLTLYLWDIVEESINIHHHSMEDSGVLGASCLVLKEFLESPIGLKKYSSLSSK